MTEVEWDVQAAIATRTKIMQLSEDTRFHERGIIGLDDVLIDKTGTFIKDSGTFWGHGENRHKHAQDLIIVNYVRPTGGKSYPLEFTSGKTTQKKEDQCQWTGDDLPSRHLPSASPNRSTLFRLLNTSDQWERVIVTERKLHTPAWQRPEIQNHIHGLKSPDGTSRGYVGDLKFNRKLTFRGVEQQAVEFAHTIPPSDRKSVTTDGVKQWYLSVCVKMPSIDHKVRVVILWPSEMTRKNDTEPRTILVTNRIHWNAERIDTTYRGRWGCTETPYFSNTDRDGKQPCFVFQ